MVGSPDRRWGKARREPVEPSATKMQVRAAHQIAMDHMTRLEEMIDDVAAAQKELSMQMTALRKQLQAVRKVVVASDMALEREVARQIQTKRDHGFRARQGTQARRLGMTVSEFRMKVGDIDFIPDEWMEYRV